MPIGTIYPTHISRLHNGINSIANDNSIIRDNAN